MPNPPDHPPYAQCVIVNSWLDGVRCCVKLDNPNTTEWDVLDHALKLAFMRWPNAVKPISIWQAWRYDNEDLLALPESENRDREITLWLETEWRKMYGLPDGDSVWWVPYEEGF